MDANPRAQPRSTGPVRSHFDLEYSAGLNPEKIKAQFIGKVYSILSIQLAYTTAIVRIARSAGGK